ncbi:MAG: glycosyltransferase [Planctomycetota bacterium]|jgi:glycosyltransferase involved in cell wall biosynthesis|nr:glycosyltransferase [Planctomycetota bacterium]
MADPTPDSGRREPELSLVIPLYNEAENVAPLWAAIRHALEDGPTFEALFIDDGSTDGTRTLLRQIAATHPAVRVVYLSRNFGQTAAMAAGFDLCRGRNVVTMDGDLQNDPADIPRLLAVLDEGYDIVCGWRRDRRDGALTRKFPSRVANRMLSWFTGVRIHDTGCTLKAYRAWVVRRLHLYSDMHRFIPALAAGVGARVGELPVRHHARRYGISKYGIGRILRVLTDLLVVRLLVRFSTHPVRYFGLASMPLFLLSLAFAAIGLLKFSRDGSTIAINRWDISYMTSSVLVAVTALNFFLLGLLCELSVSVSGFYSRAGTEIEEHGGAA